MKFRGKFKITHFNRDKRPGNYTFEQLFSCIRIELQKQVEVESFDLPSGLTRIQSILWATGKVGKVNHITGDVHYLALGMPRGNTIITVHDICNYTERLSGWKKFIYRIFWLELPLRKAKYITAISEYTKSELVRVLNLPKHKIHVIGNPVLPGIAYVPKPNLSEKPIIMQIGSGGNKNLGRLIEAIDGLPVKLLLVNKLFDKSLKEMLIEKNIDFEQRTDLDFEGLKQAYIDSDMLFFASEFEGFGMPIIEAQATGRPVITSTITSMPEVAGVKGAIFVDPFSVEQIRSAIQDIIQNDTLRSELILGGLDNAAKFTAESIANDYLNLYKKVAKIS